MADIAIEVLRHAQTIVTYRVPSAKACKDAHWALCKLKMAELADQHTSRANLIKALRHAAIAYDGVPAMAREAAHSHIQLSIDLIVIVSAAEGQ